MIIQVLSVFVPHAEIPLSDGKKLEQARKEMGERKQTIRKSNIVHQHLYCILHFSTFPSYPL